MSIEPGVRSIAIFASSFAPHKGGVEELVRQLAIRYRALGMTVVVVTNRWPRDLPAHEQVDGVDVHRFPFRVAEGSVKAQVTARLTSGRIHRDVARTLTAYRVQLIHVQCVSINGLYAHRAALDLGVPLVVTAQGERTMDATGVYDRSEAHQSILRTLLDEADQVTACSRSVLEDLETWHRPLGDRGRVIYNGVSLADFGSASDEPATDGRPFVLGLGRAVRQKGFDVLLSAFAGRLDDLPGDLDLVLAGDGPELATLRRTASELGLGSRVRFEGAVDRPRAVGLLGQASIVAMPSRIEPFGIVGLEAMAAGAPLVASATGGLLEYVESGVNGVLVPPADPGALGAALHALSHDADERARLAGAGRATAEVFEWSAIAARYSVLYRELAADRDSRHDT